MANPTPRALHDAATQLRTQATAAQQALDARSTQRENQNSPALHQALVRAETAETVSKRAHENADDLWKQHHDYRDQALKLQEQAQQVAHHGDAAQAADLNRQAADTMQRAENADARYQQAMKEASTADAELTAARNALGQAGGEFQSRTLDPMEAQRQIDLMKEKAETLDKAGRKLELAPTIDNPVERATLELDAEQLIRDAAGIQILTGEITKATGQPLQLPDVDHLPTADATPANDTDLMDPFADDVAAATTGATGDDPVAASDPSAPDGTAGDDLLGVSSGDTTATIAGDATAGDAAVGDATVGAGGGSGDGAFSGDGALAAAPLPDATDTTPLDPATDVDTTVAFDAPAPVDDSGGDFASDPLADSGTDSGAGGLTADDSTV